MTNLNHKTIHVILITGHTDITDDILEFMPYQYSYFFKISEKFLRIESYEQYSKLKFDTCDSLKWHEYPDEDDWKISFSSVAGILLKSYYYSDISIEKINMFNCTVSDNCYICDYAEIILSDGQTIKFDPLHFWGIGINDSAYKPENAEITVID
ncbi:MAG: hypothetical protein K2G14_08270 [Ruminococcus sp.]|nr:hypothetical protein [Ruminococcus sp.]